MRAGSTRAGHSARLHRIAADATLGASVPSLNIISGPRAGETIEVDRVLVVGRFETDVVIDDPELSRRHLEVRPDAEGLIIEDLGSTNGTLVGERPINAPTRVRHGDRVSLGSTVLEVILPSGREVTRPASTAVDIEATRMRPVPSQTPPQQESGPPASAGAGADAAAMVEDSPASPPARSPAGEQASAPPRAHPPSVLAPIPREPAAGAPAPAVDFVGAFQTPSERRGAGLASRSWIPVVLSFGTAVLTAVALVIYFAAR
jgi:pSer/pThr/pTyr-binding forkhead associated (FHA) protein